jgi:hypothetical protein
LIAVAADPSVAYPILPTGSVALRTDTGAIYSKFDDGWHPLAVPGATLAAIAYSANAADLTGGTLPTSVMPAFSGDMTASAGSSATSLVAHHVTNAMLRTSMAASVIGRSANSVGMPSDLTASADGLALVRTAGALGFAALPAPTTLTVGYQFASMSGASSNNNYSIPTNPIVFLHLSTTGVGPIAFSGFTPSMDGQLLFIRAEGSAASLVGNDTGSPHPLLLNSNGSGYSLADFTALLIWDATSGHWVQLG